MSSRSNDGVTAREAQEVDEGANTPPAKDENTLRATQMLERLLQRLEGHLPPEKSAALRELTSKLLNQSEVVTADEFKARVQRLVGSDLETMQAAMRSFKRDHANTSRKLPINARPARPSGITKPAHRLHGAMQSEQGQQPQAASSMPTG